MFGSRSNADMKRVRKVGSAIAVLDNIQRAVDDLHLIGIIARQNAHQQVRIERPHRFLTDASSTLVEACRFFVPDTETNFPMRASRIAWSFALILVGVTPRKSRRLPDFGRMMIRPSWVVVMISESPSFNPTSSRTSRGTSTRNLPVVLFRWSTVDPLIDMPPV